MDWQTVLNRGQDPYILPPVHLNIQLQFELYEKSYYQFLLRLSVFMGGIWFGLADSFERPAVEWHCYACHQDSVYVLSNDCGFVAAIGAE